MIRSIISLVLAFFIMIGAILLCLYSVRSPADTGAVPSDTHYPLPDAGITDIPPDNLSAEMFDEAAMTQLIAEQLAAIKAARIEEAREKRRQETQALLRARAEERRRILAEQAAIAAKEAAAPGYNKEFVAALTKEEQAEASYFYDIGYVYFRQTWSTLNDLDYSFDNFGEYGCGPTCAAGIIANLAGVPVTPDDLRKFAIDNYYCAPGGGTYYGFMKAAPAQYGIKTTEVYRGDKKAVIDALKEGKLVLATMGSGIFTRGAHYILLRGITEEGKILIADSYSYANSLKEWDYDVLYGQLKQGYYIYELEDTSAEAVPDAENDTREASPSTDNT